MTLSLDTEPLRIFTAGHVDDGKSTLIGRLLYDSRSLFDDHLLSLERDSLKKQHGGLDYSLLTDGLKAEREQGITIDVAYRYFSTPKRKFILADSPGHEQYTRNMVTAASHSELLLLLIDATRPLSLQTCRHSLLASLLGIRHFVVAVNKMDKMGYSKSAFEKIESEYKEFSSQLSIEQLSLIPISALKGDNIVYPSREMPWYEKGPLLDCLENYSLCKPFRKTAWRFPVQYILKPKSGGRFYAGTLAMGSLFEGDEAICLPSGHKTRIHTIWRGDQKVSQAEEGQAIALGFEPEIDAGRGSLLSSMNDLPPSLRQIDADLIWMGKEKLSLSQSYLLMHTTQLVSTRIAAIHHVLDVQTLQPHSFSAIGLNDVARVSLELQKPIFPDLYNINRNTGSFILIDPETHLTVAAGLICKFSHTAAASKINQAPHRSFSLISQKQRSERFGQKGCVIWFTGLSGSGKTTLSLALEKKLFEQGKFSYVLDGDVLRHGLSRDLGFSVQDRTENIRRIGETAALFADAGFIAITAFISPFRSGRDLARSTLCSDQFFEIYLSAPISCCEARDPKGLYQKARRGEISDFTGISSPYEPPLHPELTLDTSILTIEDCIEQIMALNIFKR